MEEANSRRQMLSQYIGKPVESSQKLNEIVGLLQIFGGLPSVSVGPVPGDPMADGGFNPLQRRVYLSPKATNPESLATHEMTHVLDNKMMNLTQQIRPSSKPLFGLLEPSFSPQEAQFAEGYAKMTRLPSAAAPGSLLNQQVFIPDKLSTQGLGSYRSSGSEQRAFGVSEQVGSMNPGTRHLDTTRATEFDILMDLLSRSTSNKRK